MMIDLFSKNKLDGSLTNWDEFWDENDAQAFIDKLPENVKENEVFTFEDVIPWD